MTLQGGFGATDAGLVSGAHPTMRQAADSSAHQHSRKRPLGESSFRPRWAGGGWLGMALQLPSVIRKEFGDFVKTVRQGTTNLPDPHRGSRHSPVHPVQAFPKRAPSNHRFSPVTAPGRSRTGPGTFRPFRLDAHPASPDDDHPSPCKKLKLGVGEPSGSLEPEPPQSGLQACLSSLPLVDSGSACGSLGLTRIQEPADRLAANDAPLQPPVSCVTEDTDVEEIDSTRFRGLVPLRLDHSDPEAGSNSVLFPHLMMHRRQGSPSSLQTSQSSSSAWHPLSSSSTTTSSLVHPKYFSNDTCLTSHTSLGTATGPDHGDAAHSAHLSSTVSVPTPRIRHTKILGTPRALTRTLSLSTSSLASDGDLAGNTFGRSRHKLGETPTASLIRGSGSLNNLSLAPTQARQPSKDERECLMSEEAGPGKRSLPTQQAAASSQGTSIMRPKVPLADIIGRPSASHLSDASPSQALMTLSQGHWQGSLYFNQSASHPRLTSRTVKPLDPSSAGTQASEVLGNSLDTHQGYRQDCHNAEDSAAGQNLNHVKTKSLSRNHHYGPQATIAEVDEDSDDESYEILEGEETVSPSHPFPHRKRKRRSRRSDLSTLKCRGMAAIEPSSDKLIDLLPYQSKVRQSKVLTTSNLATSEPQCHRDALQTAHKDESDITPTKKIRILETEIMRLRQELESERVKNSAESSRTPAIRHSAARSVGGSSRATSVQQRVKFSPRSPLSSSDSDTRSRGKLLSLSQRLREKPGQALLESPVLLKKPSEGALVGGSPFVVSRVFGQGPEVVGERTPLVAAKWLEKHKLGSASHSGVRLPGLAQDLFGAKLGSSKLSQSLASTRASRDCQHPAPALRERHRSGEPASGIRTNTELFASRSAVSPTWSHDRELEADLFGAVDDSRIPYSPSKNPPPAASPSKIKTLWKNSVGRRQADPYIIPHSEVEKSDQCLPQMTVFLNELRSAGKNKLRKTVGSVKYYGAQNSGVPSRSPTRQQHCLSQSREVDPTSADLLHMVIEKNFGQAFQKHDKVEGAVETAPSHHSTMTCRTTTSASTNTCGSLPGCLLPTTCPPEGSDLVAEKSRPLLARKIYPSFRPESIAGTAREGIQTGLREATNPPGSPMPSILHNNMDPNRTPRAQQHKQPLSIPTSPVQKDFTMEELIEQVSGMRKKDSITLQMNDHCASSHTDTCTRKLQSVQEDGHCLRKENSSYLTRTHQLPATSLGAVATPLEDTSPAKSVFEDGSRPRSSPILKNVNKCRPKPLKSPVRSRVEPKRPLAPTSARNNDRRTSSLSYIHGDETGHSVQFFKGSKSSFSSGNATVKRVKIVEGSSNGSWIPEPNSLRKNSVSVTPSGTDENLRPLADQGRNLVGVGAKLGGVNQVVGFGLKPGEAQTTSGSDWVVVKSDCNRLGEGEPNLQRWSLKASAIISAKPKVN